MLNWPLFREYTAPRKNDIACWLCTSSVLLQVFDFKAIHVFFKFGVFYNNVAVILSNTFHSWQSHHTMNRGYNFRWLLIRECVNDWIEFVWQNFFWVRDSFLSVKKSFNKAIFSLVFFLLFSFPCPSGNSSTETKSAHREMPEDDAMTLLVFLMKADRERREISLVRERLPFVRTLSVIGPTMISTGEEKISDQSKC